MRILYANHTGRMSGAERSLLDLLASLPAEVSPMVVCPPGRLTDAVRRLGISVMPIRETDGSLRLHPLYSSRAIIQLVRTAVSLRAFARRSRSQLIHANSIRAGVAAVLASRPGGPPVVVHVRDCLPRTRLANGVRRFLTSRASLVIANSGYTATNFAPGPSMDKVITVHNPVDLNLFSPGRYPRGEARKRLSLGTAHPVLGVIAQLAPWKAHDDAIRCFAALRSQWPDARLLLVGSAVFTSKAARFNNRAYVTTLHGLARDLGLDGSVRFLGERDDVPAILGALDLLLVPSWEEPFGRSVIEAMAMAIPVIATRIGGPAEIISDGVDGVLLPPRQPEKWATVIDELLRRPSYREELGHHGRRTAVRRFSLEAHTTRVVETYQSVLAGR